MNITQSFQRLKNGITGPKEPSSPKKKGVIEYGYVHLINEKTASEDPELFEQAVTVLREKMSYVPTGTTELLPLNDSHGELKSGKLVEVDELFIDRCAVTNAEFYQFVIDGGYENLDYWPQVVWPHVIHLTDETKFCGPRFWRDGKPDPKLLEHPVVGICWHEAAAFANWCGKTLPTGSQWQYSATWNNQAATGKPTRFPWGDSFEVGRANIWPSGIQKTVPVNSYYNGATCSGVSQLIGNVWEWVATQFKLSDDATEDLPQILAEIRGGAFDTYFESQATCQFSAGQLLLHRANNIGFRCCVAMNKLFLA